MWRRPLNNVTLATTTYKGLKEVSDGMGAQVEAWMINKCKAQMIRKSLHKCIETPIRKGGGAEKERQNTVACKETLMYWSVYIN